eukprot:948422_1
MVSGHWLSWSWIIISCMMLINEASFHFINTLMDWDDASSHCLSVGMSLVSIHDATEFAQVQAIAQTTNPEFVWIGLRDILSDNTWTWSDGTPLDYGNDTSGGVAPWGMTWGPQPDGEGEQDCGTMYRPDSALAYGWHDHFCTERFPFICTMYPTSAPSTAPSSAPTATPSMAPTAAPITCFDIDNVFSNDGQGQTVYDMINALSWKDTIFIEDPTKIENITAESQSWGQTFTFKNDDIYQIRCSGRYSCSNTKIMFQDNTKCSVVCDEELSCSFAEIDVGNCNESLIVCNGQRSCDSV